MNMWLRKVGSGAIALTLAAGLAGCNNGNGGGLLTLFFGMNNNGACDSVIVDLNLVEAGGVVARDEFQNPLCSLDQALQSAGCTATFEDVSPGGPALNQGVATNDLRATISGCSIPSVASLFQCQFTSVDLEVLQATIVAQCSCTTPGCDTTPPVCVSQKDTPGACEDCNDGKDNDKNGFTDCDDANCQYDPACQATTTTSTSSTSVTIASTTTLNSTTTSTSSTTSTTGVPPLACTIVFDLKDAVTLGSFSFDINYSAVPGQMIGSGATTQCTTLAGGTTIVVNDVDATKTATAGGFAIAGVTGPINLVSCDFLANTTPVKADFTLTGTEATDVNGDPTAIPAFGVATINCTGPTTTTTLAPTTTTTIPDATTTTTVSGPAQYKIRFKLNSACGKSVGSLGLDINYTASNGTFDGAGAAVSCTNLVAGGPTFVPNDDDANKILSLGYISLAGFTAPTDLAECILTGTKKPNASDFVITFSDISDPDGNSLQDPAVCGGGTPPAVNANVTPK